MPAILTMGERAVSAEQELEKLREQLKEEEEDCFKNEQKKAKDHKKKIEDLYVTVSEQVVSAASRAGGRWQSRNRFNRKVVYDCLENPNDSWKEFNGKELADNMGIVNRSNRSAIAEEQLAVSVPDQLRQRLENALSTTPVTVVLDSLKNHPEATAWVDQGRNFHKDVETCIFCGSPFSAERRQLIERHFSSAVKSLQSDLNSIIADLREIVRQVEEAARILPQKGVFLEELQSDYDSASRKAEAEFADLKDWAADALARAKKKLSDVLSVVDSTVAEPPVASADTVLNLIKKHNGHVQQHGKRVQEAAKAIEEHHLKASEKEARRLKSEADKANAQAKLHEQKVAGIQDEVKNLKAVEGDPMPSAKALAKKVAQLFGRHELEFKLVDGRYQVTRDGRPAEGLSLGERNAITLAHFLEHVAKIDAPSTGKPIVIIDDPISSHDNNIFAGLSTYIWNEILKGHIAQLFLLTHDFELFCQWDKQVETLSSNKKNYPAEFYEIRSQHRANAGTVKRHPVLVKWPPSEAMRKKIRSTYHHAFILLAEARRALAKDDSVEHRLDAQLLFPNVIRRMLETFLAFKIPEFTGNLSAAMEKSASLLSHTDYKGEAKALQMRLIKYAHTHSHSQSPETSITVNPDEIASVISDVFDFMYYLDKAHFDGLCKICNQENLLSGGTQAEAFRR